LNHLADQLKNDAVLCSCEHKHTLHEDVGPIVIEAFAATHAAPFLRQRNFMEVVVVADENTFNAAGKDLINQLEIYGINYVVCLINPNGQEDVVADEPSIVQVMLTIEPSMCACLIAVGSGTIHDIVRFIGFKMNIPFVSIPTAPSVDGFMSKGAPLIIRGEKKTIPAAAPIAIFADLNVLMKAPKRLVAAGFGDMIGKYTSLFDWSFSHLTAGEPYCLAAANITAQALESCVTYAHEIAAHSEKGMQVLMKALMESGFAMILFGQSHPASGAEHHLSHYWEMSFLREGKKQLLHGAKVGVASAEISQLYHQIAKSHFLDHYANGSKIKEELSFVPSPQRIRELLSLVGGACTIEQLGISPQLLARSLKEADQVRNRHTLLKAWNSQTI